MSARSPDWRSGANPSGVGPDAFLDATRARTRSSRSRLRACVLVCPCTRAPVRSLVLSPLSWTYPLRFAPRTHACDALRSREPSSHRAPTTVVLRVLTASTPINTTPRHCLPTRAGAWGIARGGARDRRREVSLVGLPRIFAG